MRTGRLRPGQSSFMRTSKTEDRPLPFLVISPPHTGKSRVSSHRPSSQANSYRLSTPRMYLKSRMIPLLLSFSTWMKVSKAAPIVSWPSLLVRHSSVADGSKTSRDEALPCQFTTGDPSNDCPSELRNLLWALTNLRVIDEIRVHMLMYRYFSRHQCEPDSRRPSVDRVLCARRFVGLPHRRVWISPSVEGYCSCHLDCTSACPQQKSNPMALWPRTCKSWRASGTEQHHSGGN